MRVISWAGSALVILVAISIGGAGEAAAGSISGSGFIEDVSIDDQTVQIAKRIYRITFRTEFVDAEGESMNLIQLDNINPGPWVQYRAMDRAGEAEISWISVVPDDD